MIRHRLQIMIPAAILVVAASSFAEKKDERGLLPEVRMDSKNENENERRAMEAEILITRAETKAIDSLQHILKRKKGTAEEPELLHRLAEMYMRRSRTGRFFDLHQNFKTQKLSTFPIPPEKGVDWIRKGATVYTDIEKRFPKYIEMDSVLFNNAFAHQQLGKLKEAETLYTKLIEQHPKSRLIPDAAVAFGELAFDQRRFGLALENFGIAQKYPDSRVYTYALYKAAWTYFNMKDADAGTKKLLEVVKACPLDFEGEQAKNRQNLRKEALRDLTIFLADSRSPGELYSFFKPITSEEEMGDAMLNLSKLYLSYSRFKDMNIFLDEFNDKMPDNPYRVRTLLTLVEANESLKARDKVLENLRTAAMECNPDSRWRKKQKPETIDESCGKSFRVKSHEIAGKWWEIWQKNKNHKEFSSLTEQALKVVLDNEDPANPDLNSRFAYAELLFQMGRFEEASENYHKSADMMLAAAAPKGSKAPANPDSLKIDEKKKLHDADYGALFAMEKAIEKKKSSSFEAKRKELAQVYLDRHPKGDHAGEVTLRMAVIAYEEQDYETSRKWLATLLEGKQGRDLQVKAEDLSLDILNLKKDFPGLSAQAAIFLKRETNPARKETLKKIEVESSYSKMQEDLKTVDKSQASQKLKAFAETHQGSKLATEALYQSAALDFTDGRGLAATKAMEEFAAANPEDKRVLDGLKESARVSAEAGEMDKAAQILKKLADREPKERTRHLEAAADFWLMENNVKEARGIYNQLLITAPSHDRSRLYTKLLETFRHEPNSPEVKRLESVVLQQGLEPFATEILTKRAQALLDAGRKSDAFDAAMKVMKRDAPAELRAHARLIQARILEGEFTSQSVKSSSESKFGMVLAMKTEKLEKAQTAYLSASKMTTDAKILAEAFSGIDRCYANFVDALEHLQAPASLSPADQEALKGEIAKLLVPIKEKRDDNRKQIRGLASAASGEQGKGSWADLAADASPVPRPLGKYDFLKPYVEDAWNDDPAKISRYSANKPSCDAKKPQFNKCFLANKLDLAEAAAREETQNKDTRLQGWHDLALVADARGLTTKALWLLKLAEKENPHHPLVRYEKGRLLAQLEGASAASADFAEVLNTSMSSTEIGILKGFKAFSEGDFLTVNSVFAGFSKQEIYHLKLGSLVSESLAQSGETDKALKLISDLTALGPDVELLVQQGRLNEVYKFAQPEALDSYQKALKIAKDPAQKEWLVRKTEYLKANFKVAPHVTSVD